MVLTAGDFAVDTAVTGANGRYVVDLSPAWEIWGPQGGYVAGAALRAAGRESRLPRPVSFSCHFLKSPAFATADCLVETLRDGRRAQSQHVAITQAGNRVVDASVWTVADLTGIDHEAAAMPSVAPPDALEPWDAYWPGGEPPGAFWRNFDVRPAQPPITEWANRSHPPTGLVWLRLRMPTQEEDPFLAAARLLTVADCAMYPAATFAHEEMFPYLAPSLDLQASFHDLDEVSDWLLVEAHSPLASGGVVAGRAYVWSADGRLLATAMQQMLQST